MGPRPNPTATPDPGLGRLREQVSAAIAARHPKWDERPVICCQRRPQSDLTEDELLAWYDGKVPRWQRPDRVVFVDSLPLGPTGKVVKAILRETHGGILWDEAMAALEAEKAAHG